MINKSQDSYKKYKQFVTTDMWLLPHSAQSKFHNLLISMLKITYLTLQGFKKDELSLRASYLTFVTLLSLAPLLAFIFTILHGLGKSQIAIIKLRDAMVDMPLQFQQFIERIIAYVENTNAVGLGGAALLLLLFIVVRLLSSIELAFNTVWKVKSNRNIYRKMSDYFSMLFLVPILIVFASTVGEINFIAKIMPHVAKTNFFYDILEQILSFLIALFGFMLLNLFIPNTRIKLKAAVLSGIITAILWLGWQQLYINFQGLLLGQQDKIFGAFASVPIFMIWLYGCWIIILFGAECAFAAQNQANYSIQRICPTLSYDTKVQLALLVAKKVMQSMDKGIAINSRQIASQLKIAPAIVEEIVKVLLDSKILIATSDSGKKLVLLRNADTLLISDIITAIASHGESPAALGIGAVDENINAILASIKNDYKQQLNCKFLRELGSYKAVP